MAQVVRAAQGLLKGEIILDYTRVQQALGSEWHSSAWRATVNEEWDNPSARAPAANPPQILINPPLSLTSNLALLLKQQSFANTYAHTHTHGRSHFWAQQWYVHIFLSLSAAVNLTCTPHLYLQQLCAWMTTGWHAAIKNEALSPCGPRALSPLWKKFRQ